MRILYLMIQLSSISSNNLNLIKFQSLLESTESISDNCKEGALTLFTFTVFNPHVSNRLKGAGVGELFGDEIVKYYQRNFNISFDVVFSILFEVFNKFNIPLIGISIYTDDNSNFKQGMKRKVCETDDLPFRYGFYNVNGYWRDGLLPASIIEMVSHVLYTVDSDCHNKIHMGTLGEVKEIAAPDNNVYIQWLYLKKVEIQITEQPTGPIGYVPYSRLDIENNQMDINNEDIPQIE